MQAVFFKIMQKVAQAALAKGWRATNPIEKTVGRHSVASKIRHREAQAQT
jgi:hypothetical protein